MEVDATIQHERAVKFWFPHRFSATAVRSPTAAPVCPAGYSGARCDRESCNGIVDVTIGGASSGTIRSHPAGASSSVWKSTSVSGAPDNSSLSHFAAMAWQH